MNRVTYTYTKKICQKCGGTGTLHHYNHIDGGRCFKCNGIGDVQGELVQHIATIEEMERALEKKGIIIERWESPPEMDWEDALFGEPTEEQIAFNEMRNRMIEASFINA